MLKVRIKVKPGARRSEIIPAQTPDGLLTVAVTAPAESGKANSAVCEVLAKWAGVSKSTVAITRGHASRIKTVEFSALDALPINESI